MRYYGLAIPGSDYRFCVPTVTPISLRPTRPMTRTSIGFGYPKAKATLNDGFVAEEASELSFYKLLGISESGSLTEIKHAYKQLARKYHPDVSPPGRVEEYTKRFIQVQEAYETLSDPSRRAMYDRDMASGIHFAFNARRRYHNHDQVIEQKSEWKARWHSQLSELKRRSKSKDTGGNMSWAARMRQQREESSNEL
ncbi:chaperone protein dnaJ 20, chloroplastic-like [Gastrolobium bilobum]|uniref:chaperone protein dnaJ 20, chloroplastic-like n=1 Tax=Gastrolobium bilobum TaxID=150636 RepID=UPI002AB19034|nr:chaperone protein dnaJ 20, chloroplastic-like [Gastrolobium bilobum]